MVDFKETAREYERNGLKYSDPTLELKRMENWEMRVTDPKTHEYNIDPNDKSVEYPRKVVTQIKRIIDVDKDNEEYLTTEETWIGRDGIGNEVSIPVSEPQCYQSPIVRYINQVDNRGVNITTPIQDGHKIIRRVKFSKDAALEAYNRSRKSTVSLLVKEIGLGRKPIKVKDFNDFVERPAYDLLDNKPKESKREDKDPKKTRRDTDQLES